MRKIELHDMMFHAYHGVGQEEQKKGGEYLVGVVMEIDFSAAEHSDELADTVNYEDIYRDIKKEMEVPSKLLEHLASRMAETLRVNHPMIQTVEVKVTKLNPPIADFTGSATVIIKK